MKQQLLHQIPIEDLSDDGEVKVKKWKMFEEICPIWYHRIYVKRDVSEQGLGKHSTCIVGEAHGFNFYYGCHDCMNFAYDIIDDAYYRTGQITTIPQESQNCIEKFTQHWNEVHNK